MKRLFIIGNGFDLNHGLPTRYTDFMNFMKSNHPDVSENFITGIKKYSLPYFDQMDKIQEDILWNDMENIFGSYEIMEMAEEHRDWNSEFDYHGPASREIRDMLHLPLHISAYLNEWMTQVHKQVIKTSPQKRLQRLFDLEDSSYISFNYTTTLETVYKIKHVWHLHGKFGETLIMGHNQTLGRTYTDPSEYGINLINEKFLKDYINRSRKNCHKIMASFPSIFYDQSIKETPEIYVLGHSLNTIDMPYFRRIKKISGKEAKWNIFILPNQQSYYLDILRRIPVKKTM